MSVCNLGDRRWCGRLVRLAAVGCRVCRRTQPVGRLARTCAQGRTRARSDKRDVSPA